MTTPHENGTEVDKDESKSKPLFGPGLFYPMLLSFPIVLLGVGAMFAFRHRPEMMSELRRGESDGRAFVQEGGKKTASECLDGAADALDTYSDPVEPGGAAFLEACLVESGLERTGGSKHSAPTRGQLEGWARDECKARGREGDKHCVLLVQLANIDPCNGVFLGQTKAAPRWQCGSR